MVKNSSRLKFQSYNVMSYWRNILWVICWKILWFICKRFLFSFQSKNDVSNMLGIAVCGENTAGPLTNAAKNSNTLLLRKKIQYLVAIQNKLRCKMFFMDSIINDYYRFNPILLLPILLWAIVTFCIAAWATVWRKFNLNCMSVTRK